MQKLKRFIIANFSYIYFVALLTFLEAAFHVMVFGNIRALYQVLFVLPIGLLLGWVADFLKPKPRKWMYWLVGVLLFLMFGSQLVYYHIFFSFYTLGQVGMGAAAITNFFVATLIAVWESLLRILILALPLVGLGFGLKWKRKAVAEIRKQPKEKVRISRVRRTERAKKIKKISMPFVAVLLYAVVLLVLLPLGGKGAYSAHDLYHETWVMDLSVEKLGLMTTTINDLRFAPIDDPSIELESEVGHESVVEPESSVTEPVTPGKLDVSPQVLDIDFGALAEAETDDELKTLHTYFSNQRPTNKNKYTGMFEGYNLVLICAESFSPAAVVDETLTPALYKLINEGFVFENYWTTFPSNTTNGEYSFLTGLLPDTERAKTNSTFLASKDHCLPFGMGSVLRGEGVNSVAYHGHTASYYERRKTHPNIGYLTYKGKNELGLSGWPESDLETVQKSIEEYIHEDRFHVYYMSVSGHHNYKFTGVNTMAERNKKTVLNYAKLDGHSNAAKAYVACNLELEYALQYLLEQLEAEGKLDNTVIALAADHYPYGLTEREHGEFIEDSMDYGTLERHKSNLIIWSGSMEEPIPVSKPCCSVDVLPTLLNLFGIDYDSRLLSGRDILSDSQGMAIIANQSFITDSFIYDSRNQKVYSLNGEEPSEEYLQQCINTVKNRFTIATSISVNDYYDLVVPKTYVGRVWKED